MVARALALVPPVVVVADDDKQRDYLQELRRRCNELVDHPEKFPELYGDVHQRWPQRRMREKDALIMAAQVRHSDLVDRRVGRPRRDGSCWGLSLRALARETGIGRPDERTGQSGRDFPGRRTLLRRLRRLHEATYLEGRKLQLHLFRGVASNRRWKIEEGRLAGRYISYPTVRKISASWIRRVELDKRMELERKDAKDRRGESIDHFIDIRRRRERDREIKHRQRLKAREQRLYYVDQEHALAAKSTRRTE